MESYPLTFSRFQRGKPFMIIQQRGRLISLSAVSRHSCLCRTSVQFRHFTDWVVGRGGVGGLADDSVDHLPVFSAGGRCEQCWHGQGCSLFDVAQPAFPLPTTASPSLQDAVKDDFGKAVVACKMPQPCEFPSLDSCQKRFL